MLELRHGHVVQNIDRHTSPTAVATRAGAARMSYSSNDAMLMAGGRDWSTCSGFPQRRGVQCARNSEPRASDDWFAWRTSRPREMTVRRRSVTLQDPQRGVTNTTICELPPVESSLPQGSFSCSSACAIVASVRPSSPDHRRAHCFLSRRLSSPNKTAMAAPDVSPSGRPVD